MREVHETLRVWAEEAGLAVSIDAAGNLRALRQASRPDAPRLVIGSHLDTVINAGAFDGPLGVVLGLALAETAPADYELEIIGFSEEEGVRYGVPFIGSRAVTGTLGAALIERIAPALRDYGLDPAQLPACRLAPNTRGYLEFHIEQGPVLDRLNLPLGIVTAIAGQTRRNVTFTGRANHAGTTPMHLRHDALTAAARWILEVEREALATAGLVATVGRCEVEPNAANVIPGLVRATLDVRHADDAVRTAAAAKLCRDVSSELVLDQPAVSMDAVLQRQLANAVQSAGFPVHYLPSGAGHDAMIIAPYAPSAMLFLRSPGGISHHPDETVRPEDVDAALLTGRRFLEQWFDAASG